MQRDWQHTQKATVNTLATMPSACCAQGKNDFPELVKSQQPQPDGPKSYKKR